MRHPADEELLAFLAGRLSPTEAAKLDAHVDECLACRALLLAFARTVSLAELKPPPTLRPAADALKAPAPLPRSKGAG